MSATARLLWPNDFLDSPYSDTFFTVELQTTFCKCMEGYTQVKLMHICVAVTRKDEIV